MKHFIWLLCGVFLSGLLLGTLSACGGAQTSPHSQDDETRVELEPGAIPEAEVEPGDPATPEAAAVPEEEGTQEEKAPATSSSAQSDSRLLAYAKVLEDALFNGVLFDGTTLDWTSAEGAAENQFAICDVDGDGEEELLLRWTNAITAGTVDIVFGYKDGTVFQELQEFAGVEFYANGTATAGWSHNQGWAGRFWPYNLYQYDPEARSYVQAGAVDAWDRICTDGDEDLAAAFPADADADGDGLVYYLLPDGWASHQRISPDGSLGQLWGTDPVDGAAHESWLNSFVDGAKLVQLPLRKLTEENIASLGYQPAPGSAQEAAG